MAVCCGNSGFEKLCTYVDKKSKIQRLPKSQKLQSQLFIMTKIQFGATLDVFLTGRHVSQLRKYWFCENLQLEYGQDIKKILKIQGKSLALEFLRFWKPLNFGPFVNICK